MVDFRMNGLRRLAVIVLAGWMATGCAQMAEVMKSTANSLDQTFGAPTNDPTAPSMARNQDPMRQVVLSDEQMAAGKTTMQPGVANDPRIEMMQQQLMILAKQVNVLKQEVMSSVAGEQRLAQIDREILMLRGRLGINPELEAKGRQKSEEINAEIVNRIKENEALLEKQQDVLAQQAELLKASEDRLALLTNQGNTIQQQAQATQQMMAKQVEQQAQIAQQQNMQSQMQRQQIIQQQNMSQTMPYQGQQAVPQPQSATPESGMATMAPKPLSPEQNSQVAMATPSDAFGMHIASYKKISQAKTAWEQYRQAYPFMLKDMKPVVAKVNFNDGRGDFYRLIAGPKMKKSEANDDCKIIKVNSGYCSVVSYDGTSLY